MNPLHIPTVGPVTGTAALAVAGILIWRTWVPRIASLFLIIAGAGLGASWLTPYLGHALNSGPHWLTSAPWVLGLVASVFLIVELFPTREVRAATLTAVKGLHHGGWTKRRPSATKPAAHAVSFVYTLVAGAIPGTAGHVVSTVVNAATSPLTAALHSSLGTG
jgi:hypothetical protein